MKKVVCPACGLVNLEKFVTFPHCAACGALLSSDFSERAPIWKRPVNALLWATILGLCCAGLGVAGILAARETRRSEEKSLIVYVQTPRHLSVGQSGQLLVALDSVETATATAREFDDLQLRFPLALLQDFAPISISPRPRRQIARGQGMYLEFGHIERDQPLSLTLRPRRAGTQRFTLSLLARDFAPFEWRGTFRVSPRAATRNAARGASN